MNNISDRILNCIDSIDQENDWTIDTAIEAGILDTDEKLEQNKEEIEATPVGASTPWDSDLRENWWDIGDQRNTGSCVGWATEAVVRYHLARSNWIRKINGPTQLSVRQIWMGSKETDKFRNWTTTFIESAGTSLKAALNICRKYGIVTDDILSFNGRYTGNQSSFFIKAAKLKIPGYIGLGRNWLSWANWLKKVGPILTRLNIDDEWRSIDSDGNLDTYNGKTYGGHAVAMVGFKNGRFIIRNSWGDDWGNNGYAHASISYASKAFTESYGIFPLPQLPNPVV